MQDLGNAELRAKIMWAATNALNSITIYGRTSPDWGVHLLGYPLSALYDTPHGATLSILYPAWMKVLRDRDGVNARIAQLGQEVFGDATVDATIASFEEFFSRLGCPLTCRAVGIDPSCKEEILALMNRDQAQGLHHKLSDAEREAIVTCAL